MQNDFMDWLVIGVLLLISLTSAVYCHIGFKRLSRATAKLEEAQQEDRKIIRDLEELMELDELKQLVKQLDPQPDDQGHEPI